MIPIRHTYIVGLFASVFFMNFAALKSLFKRLISLSGSSISIKNLPNTSMKNTETLDYISELPKPILHNILSFLSTKDIARTSALSKTWLDAWKTFPILNIDLDWMLLTGVRRLPSNSEITQKIQELYKYSEQCLLSRRSQRTNLIKFKLKVPWVYDDLEMVSTMDRWVGYALESNVKHLKIVVAATTLSEKCTYSVPPAVFNAISVQILELRYCNLHILPFINDVRLPFLKKLSLKCVFADDIVICKLVAGSPSIEEMSFISCYGITKLQIFNLANLVKFHVEYTHLEHLEMEAANLHSLSLKGSSLPSVLKVVSENLKSLAITGAPITDAWMHEQLKRFPHLESLRLSECDMLETVKISSYSLHRLSIKSCQGVATIQIDTPNLHVFSYCGDIISFSSNGLILPEVHLNFESNTMEISWYARLIELLDKFNQSFRMVVLKGRTGKSYIIPSKMRRLLQPPRLKVKELKLSINTISNELPIALLVDALLWISPHLESIYINCPVKSFFKFSYKKPIDGESRCYKSLPVSCWNHCIKDVKIKQIFRGFYYHLHGNINPNSESIERNYIFNQDIWEKIRSGVLDWNPYLDRRKSLLMT